MGKAMFKFKNDIYKKNRGGYSRFLNLYCNHCGAYLLLYQKDGPGPLKRLYLDRIFAPENVRNLHQNSMTDIPSLTCTRCKEHIGIPSIYKKEKRKAYLLFSYSVIKKVSTGVYPPKLLKLDVK